MTSSDLSPEEKFIGEIKVVATKKSVEEWSKESTTVLIEFWMKNPISGKFLMSEINANSHLKQIQQSSCSIKLHCLMPSSSPLTHVSSQPAMFSSISDKRF